MDEQSKRPIRYLEIAVSIDELDHQIDLQRLKVEQANHLLYASWAEELRDANLDNMHSHYGFGVDLLMAALMNLETRRADLWKLMPCEVFAARFGWFLHEAYRVKYPISPTTQVKDIHTDHPVWYLAKLKPDTTTPWYTPDIPFPIVAHEQIEIRFETWGERDPLTWVGLAYNQEMDTVFVQKRSTMR